MILRLVLATLLIVVGVTITARMLAFGLQPAILPGVALGAAMVFLGIHRVRLILRVMSAR
jgi:hypothetical protein